MAKAAQSLTRHANTCKYPCSNFSLKAVPEARALVADPAALRAERWQSAERKALGGTSGQSLRPTCLQGQAEFAIGNARELPCIEMREHVQVPTSSCREIRAGNANASLSSDSLEMEADDMIHTLHSKHNLQVWHP